MDILKIIDFYSVTGKSIFGFYNLIGRPVLDLLHIIFNSAFYFFLFFAVALSAVYIIISINSIFNKNTQKEKELKKGKEPLVTIQIPTYNELAALRCAKKCLEFDYPSDKFEIIIGDDSSDVGVSKKIDEFAKKYLNVKVTRRGNNIGYKSGNLNHMLKYSKGEILVLFDSDFVPEKDFLKRIVAPFTHDKNISAVQSRWKFIDRNKNMVSILGSTIIEVFHHICLPFINKKANISFLCGSAEAVRKSSLIELGGWETGSLTEDIEFSLRLHNNGKKVIYLDQLTCKGEVPYKPEDLYKQQMRWGFGVIYSFKEHFKKVIIKNKILKLKEKFFITFFCSGYFMSFLLFILFTTGTLSFLTHPPGPIDLARFFSEMALNIALTSGLVLASIIALLKTRNISKFFSMLAASFSVGLIVTYYVNVGIIKVFLNKPMKWYMLSKKGNNAADY